MDMRIALAAAAAALVLVGVTPAEAQKLSDDGLKQTVAGKTVVLNTPMGGLPISYRANGTMSGRAKNMAMYTGRESDKGRWWVKSDQICQQWDSWLDGRAWCFSFNLSGRTVHWTRTDGTTGTATIASN